ncbi:MAG: hypothetical protein LC715_00590 [Gammaproteobacteria bacterium]|nr:hypothetical protein [Gammaproteobacteria bacterium]
MLRELSHLLDELHDGLLAVQARGGVQLSNVDMTLPLELRPVLRDGGCVLLADLPRSREVNDWMASPSKLRVSWSSGGDSVRRSGEGGNPATLLSAQEDHWLPRVESDRRGLETKMEMDPRLSALVHRRKSVNSGLRGNGQPDRNVHGEDQP